MDTKEQKSGAMFEALASGQIDFAANFYHMTVARHELVSVVTRLSFYR